MKVITWNVNGWRSMLKNDHLINLVKAEKPDIICLQETKLNEKTHIEFEGYEVFENTASRPGYSGTAILYKPSVVTAHAVRFKKNKTEGRICMMEFEKFCLVNVYTPNSGQQGLKRLEYRTNYWDRQFTKVIDQIKKKVIIVGDLNVARTEQDIANPKTNRRSAGFTDEERNSFERILKELKLVDVWRTEHPDKVQYSFWSNFHRARERNVGWRIDYVLTDKMKIQNCRILDHVMGSDHAPIVFEIVL